MDKWDKQEKLMDKAEFNLKEGLPPHIKKLMIQAIDIYLEHSHKCHSVKLLLSDTEIKKLECPDCGWKYHKKSKWNFFR